MEPEARGDRPVRPRFMLAVHAGAGHHAETSAPAVRQALKRALLVAAKAFETHTGPSCRGKRRNEQDLTVAGTPTGSASHEACRARML